MYKQNSSKYLNMQAISENLVNDSGNQWSCNGFGSGGAIPHGIIDSEKWLFDYKFKNTRTAFPPHIKEQFNVRNCASGIAMEMDGGEEQFFVDSKPITVGLQEENVGILKVLRRTRIISGL